MRRRRSSHRTPPTGRGHGPLARVDRYELELAVVDATLEAVAHAGARGDELFVAWAAGIACGGRTLRFTTTIVPRQRCVHTPDGMLVVIDDEALFELNRRCYEAGEVLAGQAHAHPSAAYHSRADDGLAITPFAGSLSLVIPDFGRGGSSGSHAWRWYRRDADGSWRPIDPVLVEVV